jgi:hypothetical protein
MRQAADSDRRSGGIGLAEIPGIHPVHRGEIVHSDKKYAGTHDIVEAAVLIMGNPSPEPEDC